MQWSKKKLHSEDCLFVCLIGCMLCFSAGWSYRIHGLLICRGVRHPPNECPVYDSKQSDGEVGSSDAGALGNTEHPFMAISPRSTQARNRTTW